MDSIHFDLVEDVSETDNDRAGAPVHGLRYRINGRDLLDMVREIEEPFAAREGHPNIAGGYGALPLREFERDPRYFLGNDDPTGWPEPPWTNLYVCAGCGEAGCWPLYVQIDADVETVRWHSFSQPFRDEESHEGQAGHPWSYRALGPFEFDRAAYEADLEALALRVRDVAS